MSIADSFRMKRAHMFEDFPGVPARIHAVLRVSYDAFPVDDERRAGNAETLLSFDFPVATGTVAATHVTVDVRQQPEHNSVLVAEIRMGEAFIPAHTDDNAVAPPEIFLQVAEFDCFCGAARGVILDVEIKHRQMPPDVFAQVEQFKIGIRQFEQRSGFPCIQHARPPAAQAACFCVRMMRRILTAGTRRNDAASGVREADIAVHQFLAIAPV
jgi:hypothetical protein